MNFNKVIIAGNLTRDPEKRTLPDSGTSVVSLGIATNSYFKDKSGQNQQRAEFHNVVLFGNVADTVAKYLKKGSVALVEGRLQTSSWDDKEGNKRYRTEIVGERVQFGPKGDDSPKQDSEDKKERDIPVINEDDEIDVEDIPF